jgi:hypothetical protein
MKIAGGYGNIVGSLMLVQWGISLVTRQVPEVQTEPFRIYFHLVAEFSTAISLIVAGIGLFKNCSWARTTYMVAAGMLLYSVIVSPGYFAQQGQWAMVALFALLLIFTLWTIMKVGRFKQA